MTLEWKRAVKEFNAFHASIENDLYGAPLSEQTAYLLELAPHVNYHAERLGEHASLFRPRPPVELVQAHETARALVNRITGARPLASRAPKPVVRRRA